MNIGNSKWQQRYGSKSHFRRRSDQIHASLDENDPNQALCTSFNNQPVAKPPNTITDTASHHQHHCCCHHQHPKLKQLLSQQQVFYVPLYISVLLSSHLYFVREPIVVGSNIITLFSSAMMLARLGLPETQNLCSNSTFRFSSSLFLSHLTCLSYCFNCSCFNFLVPLFLWISSSHRSSPTTFLDRPSSSTQSSIFTFHLTSLG
jgi:hypothetical protein